MSFTPFVVGQWVRGERFYGRQGLIHEILDGPLNWLWLAGTRRIGKTSLLKQLELVAGNGHDSGFMPLFWDLQAVSSTAELHDSFAEYVEDAADRLEALEIDVDDLLDDDLFVSFKRLRRKLKQRDRRLLLLCDEAEKLIELNEGDETLLPKLRGTLLRYEDTRTVMAATIRLWRLAEQKTNTSPFLHGISPLYIRTLDVKEAESLIRQVNLPSESRPRIDDQTVEIIRTRCDNHPFLIQLLCRRYLDLGDIDEAIEQVAADPMVGFFFSVDFEMLSPLEQRALGTIANQGSSTSHSIQGNLRSDSSELAAGLQQLESLGYIRRDPERRFILINHFFKRWFEGNRPSAASPQKSDGPRPSAASLTLPLPAAIPEVPGSFDGRYDLLERVGEGATGIVFKAHDRLLRADAAIKVLKPHYAENESALERFRREILLARDIGHPNVVNVYHLGQHQRWNYLTMKWIDGDDLANVIAAEAPLAVQRVAYISRKLASALGAAHEFRVLHRDIKPRNILIDRNGEPQLMDFGLARVVDEPGVTMVGHFVGSPAYASPEQGAGQPTDERSDLYSLGVVIYEMATGERAFDGKTTSEVLRQHHSAVPRSPREHHPDLPKEFEAIILRCLEKKPEDRYASAADLEAALAPWAAGGTVA